MQNVDFQTMAHYATDDPIYALATPYYPSALAVIRASGDGVLSLLSSIFSSSLKARVNHGYIMDGNERVDEVVVIAYEKGHGYTTEEAFEIMCHGSLPIIRRISRILERIGMREAEKGEFTYRAFMHGRIDLTEAEAVEEIVSARTERAGEDALCRLTGSIKREAEKAKDEILDILSSVEVQLDYGEDEIPEEWVFPKERIDSVVERLELIASTYASSRLYSHGASVVLIGHTNAGKSSLFNAILKENRAIVSSEAGTTRDYIETEALIEGIPVRLFDTAGIRDTDGDIEREGIKRSKELMKSADLIVYVLDGEEEDEYPEEDNVLKVRSKRDLTGLDEGLSFSAVTGEGIPTVLSAIAAKLKSSDEAPVSVPRIDSERQLVAIKETVSALKDAEASIEMGEDVIAMYLQAALSSLSALTGEVTTEDLLEHLFSSFCLGK